MADGVNPADDRPTPQGARRAARPTPSRTERLPLFGLLGRNSSEGRRGGTLGLVGVAIVGALALVIALIAVTIAIGRAPQDTAVGPNLDSATPTASSQVTYTSPEPTGTRWTPEPIITGVPQNEPSYDPTPTPTPTPSKDEDEDEAPGTAAAQPTGSANAPGQTVIGRPPRGPDAPGGNDDQGNP